MNKKTVKNNKKGRENYKKIIIDMIKAIDDYKVLKIIYEIVAKYYINT